MGEHDLFQKIGFIGLGLIGGSIAKKIHTLYPDVTIIATAGHQETITEAYGEHLISNQNLCEIKDFYDCDYIFLCTPVKRNIEYLRQLKGNIKNGCIITALLMARLMRSTIIRGESTPFVMELPPYRVPTLRSVVTHCWERTWMYLKKAGTVLVAVSILIWASMTFPTLDPEQAAPLETQIAALQEKVDAFHHSI